MNSRRFSWSNCIQSRQPGPGSRIAKGLRIVSGYGGRTTCWPFGAVYAPKEGRANRAYHRPRHRATSPLARLMRFEKNVCRLVCEIPVPPSRNQWSEIPGAGHAERAAVRAAAWACKGVDDVSTRTRPGTHMAPATLASRSCAG